MFVPEWEPFELDVSLCSEHLLNYLRSRWPARQWPESLDKMSPRIAKLPFYNKIRLLSLIEPDRPRPSERYFLVDDEETTALDWTNEPIYSANERDGMNITPSTLVTYAKFFFHFVRGQLGRFILVETPDELLWLSDKDRRRGVAAIAKQNITIGPVTYTGLDPTGELHVLRSHMQFKNALFETEIYVAPYDIDVFDEELGETEHFTLGQLKLTNEQLLLEDMNVHIDPPPGEFG